MVKRRVNGASTRRLGWVLGILSVYGSSDVDRAQTYPNMIYNGLNAGMDRNENIKVMAHHLVS